MNAFLSRRARSVAAVLLAAAVPALAFAQEELPIDIHIDAKVTPNKAGTPRDPQGVVISVKGRIDMPEAFDPPLVDTVDVYLPKAGVFNGRKFPKCSQTVLNRRGPRGCPRRSIMGSGGGKATADTTFTYPKITIVNGGAKKIYFYTVLNNPARVQTPVAVAVKKLPASKKWGYHAHAKIPRNLQIVAGVPIVLREFHGEAGRRDWIATTSCPRDKLWRYHVDIGFTTGQTRSFDGEVRCR